MLSNTYYFLSISLAAPLLVFCLGLCGPTFHFRVWDARGPTFTDLIQNFLIRCYAVYVQHALPLSRPHFYFSASDVEKIDTLGIKGGLP